MYALSARTSVFSSFFDSSISFNILFVQVSSTYVDMNAGQAYCVQATTHTRTRSFKYLITYSSTGTHVLVHTGFLWLLGYGGCSLESGFFFGDGRWWYCGPSSTLHQPMFNDIGVKFHPPPQPSLGWSRAHKPLLLCILPQCVPYGF